MLLVDNRERNIFPELKTLFGNLDTKQLNVGDYHINYKDNILACFERKTWKDFAASFKDGRYENKEKMINFRKESGSKLFYIIEGNKPKSGIVEGIELEKIYCAIRKLIICDDIHIIYTKDKNYTAKILYDYCNTYIKEIDKGNIILENYDIKAGSETITKKQELTLNEKKIKLWRSLPNIGQVNAIKLANDDFKNILENENRYNNYIKNNVLKIKNGDIDVWKSLLSGVNGWGKKTIDDLFTVITPSDILNKTDNMKNIKINGKNIDKKIYNIYEVLEY